MTAPLPELYERISAAPGLGEAAALRLVHDFGGQRIYVPRPDNIDVDHALAVSLGLVAARAVADLIGSGHVIVPMGPAASEARTARAIRKMIAEKVPTNTIAKRAGVSRRCVERHRQRMRENEELPDLFAVAGVRVDRARPSPRARHR